MRKMNKTTTYFVTANGIIMGYHDNCHNTLNEAKQYFRELKHFDTIRYGVVKRTNEFVCYLKSKPKTVPKYFWTHLF